MPNTITIASATRVARNGFMRRPSAAPRSHPRRSGPTLIAEYAASPYSLPAVPVPPGSTWCMASASCSSAPARARVSASGPGATSAAQRAGRLQRRRQRPSDWRPVPLPALPPSLSGFPSCAPAACGAAVRETSDATASLCCWVGYLSDFWRSRTWIRASGLSHPPRPVKVSRKCG